MHGAESTLAACYSSASYAGGLVIGPAMWSPSTGPLVRPDWIASVAGPTSVSCGLLYSISFTSSLGDLTHDLKTPSSGAPELPCRGNSSLLKSVRFPIHAASDRTQQLGCVWMYGPWVPPPIETSDRKGHGGDNGSEMESVREPVW